MKVLVITIPIVVFLAAMLIGVLLLQPVNRNDTTSVIFVVNEGEAVSTIAKQLEEEGLVRSRFAFLFEVRRLGIEGKIQAGDFRLTRAMSPAQIAQGLTTGTLDIWVRIIEGWRAEEVAAVFKEKLPAYDNSWVSKLKQHEGYLFPDTYLIPKNAAIAQVITIFQGNFDKKTESVRADIGKNGLSEGETVILASIIEREAIFDEDRSIISGILLNRLRIGMALQADATVQYALGFQQEENDWWKKNLTKEDLQMNSPFNTYRFPGLPPKPIANPGLASLQAAFNPVKTDYLYYLHDKTGHTHYAKTLEEHNENVKKYL